MSVGKLLFEVEIDTKKLDSKLAEVERKLTAWVERLQKKLNLTLNVDSNFGGRGGSSSPAASSSASSFFGAIAGGAIFGGATSGGVSTSIGLSGATSSTANAIARQAAALNIGGTQPIQATSYGFAQRAQNTQSGLIGYVPGIYGFGTATAHGVGTSFQNATRAQTGPFGILSGNPIAATSIGLAKTISESVAFQEINKPNFGFAVDDGNIYFPPYYIEKSRKKKTLGTNVASSGFSKSIEKSSITQVLEGPWGGFNLEDDSTAGSGVKTPSSPKPIPPRMARPNGYVNTGAIFGGIGSALSYNPTLFSEAKGTWGASLSGAAGGLASRLGPIAAGAFIAQGVYAAYQMGEQSTQSMLFNALPQSQRDSASYEQRFDAMFNDPNLGRKGSSITRWGNNMLLGMPTAAYNSWSETGKQSRLTVQNEKVQQKEYAELREAKQQGMASLNTQFGITGDIDAANSNAMNMLNLRLAANNDGASARVQNANNAAHAQAVNAQNMSYALQTRNLGIAQGTAGMWGATAFNSFAGATAGMDASNPMYQVAVQNNMATTGNQAFQAQFANANFYGTNPLSNSSQMIGNFVNTRTGLVAQNRTDQGIANQNVAAFQANGMYASAAQWAAIGQAQGQLYQKNMGQNVVNTAANISQNIVNQSGGAYAQMYAMGGQFNDSTKSGDIMGLRAQRDSTLAGMKEGTGAYNNTSQYYKFAEQNMRQEMGRSDFRSGIELSGMVRSTANFNAAAEGKYYTATVGGIAADTEASLANLNPKDVNFQAKADQLRKMGAARVRETNKRYSEGSAQASSVWDSGAGAAMRDDGFSGSSSSGAMNEIANMTTEQGLRSAYYSGEVDMEGYRGAKRQGAQEARGEATGIPELVQAIDQLIQKIDTQVLTNK